MLKGPPIILEAVEVLAKAIAELPPDERYAPTAPRALLVGGFVRDVFLEREAKDADVEVYGVAPDKLEEMVRELFSQVESVGSSFGILKVRLAEDYELDIGVPRKEAKVGPGHRGFSVETDPGLSLRDAARRRDFTVNAIAIDPLSGATHDPYGGLDDIKGYVLRHVDADTFREDPLRVYRGVQLAARLEFVIEDKTLSLMKEMVTKGELEELSKERVTDELKKLLLKAEKPSRGFEYLQDLGIISRYYPELEALRTTQQEPEWHPEGSVWTHTLLVIDVAARLIHEREFSAEDQLTVMLGALCHDLGKPSTTKSENGRWRSKGHEEAGEQPTKQFFTKGIFGKTIEQRVIRIVKDHLKPGVLLRELEKGQLDDKQYANAIRRLLRRLGDVPVEVFLTVTEADKRGRGFADALTAPYVTGERMRRAIAENDLLTAVKTPLLSGGEIIELTGVTPGPKVGELQKIVEEAQDAGTIATREEAITFLRQRT